MKKEVFIEFDAPNGFAENFKSKDWIGELKNYISGLNDKIQIDEHFMPIVIDNKDFNEKAKANRFVIVASLANDEIEALSKNNPRIAIYVNPTIGLCPVNPRTSVGTDKDVAKHLASDVMKQNGMTGKNVLVAIVDNGINKEVLRKVCVDVKINKPEPTFYDYNALEPCRETNMYHGTMVAYDVLIAAPNCTLIDAELCFKTSTSFSQTLKDALIVFDKLHDLMKKIQKNKINELKGFKSMVIVNSWAMFNTSEEVGLSPSVKKYSDDPQLGYA